jgi:hypothetical protein
VIHFTSTASLPAERGLFDYPSIQGRSCITYRKDAQSPPDLRVRCQHAAESFLPIPPRDIGKDFSAVEPSEAELDSRMPHCTNRQCAALCWPVRRVSSGFYGGGGTYLSANRSACCNSCAPLVSCQRPCAKMMRSGFQASMVLTAA